MKYNNRVVVITGAAKGIGRAIAMAYTEQGATAVILDKDADSLKGTQEIIESKKGVAIPFVLELTNPDAIVRTFADIRSSFGKIDILINNAGLGITKSLFDLSVEEWDYVINTNLRGSFVCAREAARIMREGGSGSIVNIASTRALMSEANTEAYSASKGGILSLTHALAISLAPDNIRVNAISPGWIETGNYGALTELDHAQHPAGRVGRPDDIVRACFYLTDPDNDFVTGTNLVVDGGMTRKMIYVE